MRTCSTRQAGAGARALGLALLLVLAGCGDDGGTATTGTSAAPTTTATPPSSAPGGTTSTAPAPTTTVPSAEEAAIDVVRAFATDEVGMVDPVIGPVGTSADDPGSATVEVRTRREGGAADPSLAPTVVTLRADDDGWRIESATGPHLRFESPPPDTLLSAGFVTPSGYATAYEGTVIVRALVESPSGWRELGEEVTTAEGQEDAFWAARVETGVEATGAGFLLATTTAGTDLGPPAFALVPVRWGRP